MDADAVETTAEGVGAELVEITVTGIAAGGAGVGRADDGMVFFAEGALPGERVRVHVVERRRRHARSRVVEVVEASPHRRTPPCPHVAQGCGGCDWQHVALDEQRRLHARIVTDALERISGLGQPPVGIDPSLPAGGHRTALRAAVADGRAGLRRRRSHEPVAHESCLVAHPLAEEILVDGRFGDAREVSVRVGARTGERMVVVTPDASEVSVPSDVLVVGDDELRKGRRAWIHEELAGRRWRISARSFFQSRPDAAERLVDLVGAAVADAVVGPAGKDAPLVDLYAGVGLFAGTVAPGRPVVAVERGASSVADARVNLADREAPTRVVRAAVESWRPSAAAVVVADPARAGLGGPGAAVVAATGATRVVLVACDAGSLGRDVGLLVDGGYDLSAVTVVDMFPHTSNIEAVAVLDRR